MNRKQLLLLTALYVLLTLFASGRWALTPVAWLAPVVALYLIHRLPAGRGFLLLLVATYIPIAVAWYGIVPFPMPIYPIFMLVNALVGTLIYLADRLITPRLGAGFATTLVFPLIATAVEFVMMADGPLGSFGAQVYTQAAFLPLTQLVSVTGLWGVTFVMAWFAAVVHWSITRYQRGESYRLGGMICAGVLAVILIGGGIRLATAQEPTDYVAVASFTAVHVEMGELMELLSQDEAAFRQISRANHAAYLAQTVEAAATGAQIVLWPELAGLGMADDVADLVTAGQKLADEQDIYLAMPLFVLDPAGTAQSVNKMVVADPAGQIVLEHVKYGGNMLEGTLPGIKELQTVQTPFGLLSGAICWDTDYPTVMSQAGRQGVDILLSPAHVWPEVAAIHAEMAAFRSIENGMAVMRQSDDGYSQVSDSYGRIVAQDNQVDVAGRLFTAQLPINRVDTLYPVWGDVVGQGAMVGFLLAVVLSLLSWFRSRKDGRVEDAG